MITPGCFRSIPCPTYPEIRLALFPGRKLKRLIKDAQPAAIHISTEGPLGYATRRYCLKNSYPFTTAYHTRFPEYVHARTRLPLAISYAILRRFHRPSSTIMVATQTIEDDLRRRGFSNIRRWTRGVDTDLFRPMDKNFLPGVRPISLFVGRVSVEKNIAAFLDLDIPGTKYVVGDGPQINSLRRQYPKVIFTGLKQGDELARHVAAADVFIFPSKTDTFGLVLLESLAAGVPVAAYPVAGPLDVIDGSGAGVLDEDLRKAALLALKIPADTCRRHALKFSWDQSTEQFLSNLDVF